MENSVGTFRTDRLMQGELPSQVTVNTGSTVRAIRSITKDAIVLSIRFAAILKKHFLKIVLFES